MGDRYINLFRSRSALNRELLQNLKPRPPNILFNREANLDLGGVTVRLFWLGAAHTQGDELIFVKQDSVLFPGDIVQNKLVPNLPDEDASVKSWIAVLDKLEPLHPRQVVPDHGTLGDASLIGQERAFLVDLQTRALALKREGKSVEQAGQLLTTEFEVKYPDWSGMRAVPNAVRRACAEGQWRRLALQRQRGCLNAPSFWRHQKSWTYFRRKRTPIFRVYNRRRGETK